MIKIELSDIELREVHYATNKEIEAVQYEIDEFESTHVLQTKKIILENVLSKLNLAYDYEKRLKNK